MNTVFYSLLKKKCSFPKSQKGSYCQLLEGFIWILQRPRNSPAYNTVCAGKAPRGSISVGNVAWERPGWKICPWTHWARKW